MCLAELPLEERAQLSPMSQIEPLLLLRASCAPARFLRATRGQRLAFEEFIDRTHQRRCSQPSVERFDFCGVENSFPSPLVENEPTCLKHCKYGFGLSNGLTLGLAFDPTLGLSHGFAFGPTHGKPFFYREVNFPPLVL